MKKTFLSLLLFVMATTMNAQVGLKGDMNGDGKIDVADVTALVNVAIGRSEAELINPYAVDNSRVAGTWYAPDGSSFTFNADGTTNYPGGTTYQFMPFMGQLVVSSATGEVVKTMKITAITAEYLQEESTINGAVTRYISAASIVSAITLNETTLSINCGETAQLTATVSPSNALNTEVAWTSSDENVATVSEIGLVTAVAGGTCTITCTAQDGAGASASCEVTVIQSVASITLNQTTLSLSSGATSQLAATILPTTASNKNVTWTSSDENVATVSQTGLVTAVGSGSCTITATAQDGSGVSATCEVTIYQLVTGITLNQSSLSLNIGETAQLTVTILPSNASNKNVTWSSSDTNVATVNENGLVTAIAGGNCTITCMVQDDSGVVATCEVTILGNAYVDLDLPSGTLWATCNIGADNPEDYGDYFAWGETVPYSETGKTTFDWTTYKYCNGSSSTLTKYCNNSDYGYNGFKDNLTELLLEDDAAIANWDSNWRIPTYDQLVELYTSDNVTIDWTTINGVYGRKITSKSNGNSIFLPAAGYHDGTSLGGVNSIGKYWSRTLWKQTEAYTFALSSGSMAGSAEYRCVGLVVRPVRVFLVTSITLSQTSLSLIDGETQTLVASVQPSNASEKRVTWVSSNTSVATVNASGLVTAVGPGSCTITCTAKDGSGKCATCSVSVTPQLVTSITFNRSSLSINYGSTSQLNATIYPSHASNKSVSWTSSDTSVATVDQNGQVTAISVGTCTITCTAQDGSGVSATCSVIVIVDLSGSIGGREYVDLGLPSRTLWSTCNIGSNSAYNFGDYFAWGETATKSNYSWSTYTWCNGSSYNTLTKYCQNSSYGNNGFTDTLTELESGDDAATAIWGSNWCMPSEEQMSELLTECTWNWITINGVSGSMIVGSNGNSIFLPAAGYRSNTSLTGDREGRYWTRTVINTTSPYALFISINNVYGIDDSRRQLGYSIRPVRNQ